MGGSASNGHCICCAFRTEYALHVGYNRRGFLNLHACCRAKQINSDEIICHANQITPEAIMPNQSLNLLVAVKQSVNDSGYCIHLRQSYYY